MRYIVLICATLVFICASINPVFSDDGPPPQDGGAPSSQPSPPSPVSISTVSPPSADLPKGLESLHVDMPKAFPFEFVGKNIENVITLTAGVALVNCERPKRIYEVNYPPGRYRTTVEVFEGRVFVCSYDEYELKERQGVVLAAGQKTSQEAVIR